MVVVSSRDRKKRVRAVDLCKMWVDDTGLP